MLDAWFNDAKFGIFLHWGIYSLGNTRESWGFFRGEISHAEYMAQANEFTASKYDPDSWASLFTEAGAKYAVLTTKHHDGFALWDTQLSCLNAKDASPAKRDLVGPYCQALRNHGLKVGLYYSHLDWSHPDYASVLPHPPMPGDTPEKYHNAFAYPQGAENPAAWERFLAFHRGQLKELCTRYSPDLLWFDGDWERSPQQWRFEELRNQLKHWSDGVIVNSRMGDYGDYGTPEQAIPIARPDGPWEFCVTINDSWGYRKDDHNHKTARQCIRMLAECAGMGGNLLLDVGPKADGTLQAEHVEVLKGIGRWTKKYGEAIYGTVAGLPPGHFYGTSTLNKETTVLYLFCFDRPYDQVAVKGIHNKVRRTSILGGTEAPHRIVGGAGWLNLPGVLWIDVPEEQLDRDATVIKIELEGPLNLYTGSGHAITQN